MRLCMKQTIFHFIIYACITGSLSSCENEIPYNLEQKAPLLIMNALLDAGETENFVYLNLSGTGGIGHVDDATVTLTVNGKVTETLEELPPLKPVGNPDSDNPLNFIPEINKRKKFRIHTALQPGDVVRLEAVAEKSKYHVSAEVNVPQPISTIHVDTTRILLKSYGSWNAYLQFKINMQDRKGEKNYYRLDIRQDITVYGQDIAGKDTIIYMRNTEFINREDIILTDGNPISSDNDNNDFFGTDIKNKYNVFNDSRFTDTGCTLKVYTSLYNNNEPPHIHNVSRRSKTFTVRLLSITEAEYRYLKALNFIESDDYESALVEPVIIPSNVKNGLGFVGASSETRVILKLPDEITDNNNPATTDR